MANKGTRIGVLTLSDKGSRGERVDTSGPLVVEMVQPLGSVEFEKILPDDREQIFELLCLWSDKHKLDLILTTGGTGLSPRDVTPEATRDAVDREVPGIAEAMRVKNLEKAPRAMLSRGIAGMRNSTLIINLPGSPKAVRENMLILLPVLEHALQISSNNSEDCAQS